MATQKFNFKAKSLSEPGSPEHTLAPTAVPTAELTQAVNRLESKEHTPMEIRLIPRSRIHNNQKNTYPAVTINELADSILHYGLQQPLTVVYLLAEDIYLLEAGHQRAAALDQLINTYKDNGFATEDVKLYEEHIRSFERGYPCIVQARLADDIDFAVYSSDNIDQLPESVIDSEIRLIITNEIKRPDDPSVRAANVSRLTKLYARKNANRPRAEKVNINKQIAADLHITERQVANYKSLDKLIPELKEEFDRSNLSLKNSTLIAKLDAEDQQQLLQLIQSGGTIKADEVTALLQEKNRLLKQLEDKEDTIKTLSGHSDGHSEQLEAKELQIQNLKKKLDALHTQNQVPPLSDHAGRMISADLKLRAALSAASDSLNALKKQIVEFRSLELDCSETDTARLSILTKEEILEQCEALCKMLTIIY